MAIDRRGWQSIRQRPFGGPSDFGVIMQLARQAPLEQFSATALPYQLSSWALDQPANVGLWEDDAGQLLAFALLQVPFASLFYTIHPSADTPALTDQILRWGLQRATAIAREQGTPFTFSVFVAEGQAALADQVTAHGFVRQMPDRVLLWRQDDPPPRLPLPVGFTLRHLNGAAEVPAATTLLAEAFNITTVTLGWRQQILAQTAYRPELDVVVAAPSGELAAFCLCWLHPNGQIGQIEPMGTRPKYQRLGLGRAALIEGLWRLHGLGVQTVYVGTSAANQRSLPLYQSVGFRVHHVKWSYQITVANFCSMS